MRKIVCFGEALIDMLGLPTGHPDAPTAFHQNAGGAPANVAVGIARLGGPACFVGMLGRDLFGDFLLERMAAAGVDLGHVQRTDAARTALAFVSLDAQGERSFSFYRPPSADLLFESAHFQPACFESLGTFHACSNSLTGEGVAQATLDGMRRARAAGALVSFDMNLRPALWPADVTPGERIAQALALADLVKLSREELTYLAAFLQTTDEAAIARLLAGHTRLLVITDGGAPLRWYTRSGRGERAGFEVTVRDTTAAGDAFVAGLLFALARRGVDAAGLDALAEDAEALDEPLRFAAATGALAVTRAGAFAAMPSLAQVQALLETERRDDAIVV
ncbi:carbohydrate kinase [Pseudoxanthomonas winnipegensis]|jgi:fructokinase|uniref:Carbohydrate kinase n=1 Tax=Pseudoxanthomonas winnipegensis TaxID=2480810 RepID=A0ABY1WAF7_9GAMM|nr:carbohydrate kinase [Pseudoxanthomonas winnipegensis]TAA07480.1 carbohydrate kinase [Pseudoxanthomonas winnipegensis]TAA17507.1 carbohydrate kinase [Pseudoxanthomonas winnipegensis]TAH71227.1 carbohydrate kinase [Pseudoxanthomonas winnipegensis]